MKNYQIYVDSNDGTTPTLGVGKRDFKFDWNIIPEGEYEMTFVFMSQLQKLTNADAELLTYPMQLSISVPFSSDRFEVFTGANSGYANSTNIAGYLEIKDQHKTGTHTMRLLTAGYTSNPPVILRGKPQGMDFRVEMFAHAGVAPTNSPNYNLLVNLKHIC
jgi:hypothetical protein|tara:strand:- start:233 stop:715 length:483 start_codon:yes stop_codon:yes gene_type:complete